MTTFRIVNDVILKRFQLMIEFIRFVAPIQFGGEMLQTLVLQKKPDYEFDVELRTYGINIRYILPHQKVKIRQSIFVPYSNIHFISGPEDVDTGIPPTSPSANEDTSRKGPRR